PTTLDELGGGGHGAADLGITELGGPKRIAFAPDHADQKRGGGPSQLLERHHERALALIEQITVTRLQPRERGREILEVVERTRVKHEPSVVPGWRCRPSSTHPLAGLYTTLHDKSGYDALWIAELAILIALQETVVVTATRVPSLIGDEP